MHANLRTLAELRAVAPYPFAGLKALQFKRADLPTAVAYREKVDSSEHC
jgi:hypothetical protein